MNKLHRGCGNLSFECWHTLRFWRHALTVLYLYFKWQSHSTAKSSAEEPTLTANVITGLLRPLRDSASITGADCDYLLRLPSFAKVIVDSNRGSLLTHQAA
ncbi:hypothetical protein KLER11_gp77 [Pararheinheimera phage vB_PsoM_KLER1-1]|nr:hypothetical protein KLER11_gp77 [Pararheinheimera phage vB_PsoM_KLER1-1]